MSPEPIEWRIELTESEKEAQRAFFTGIDRPVCAVVCLGCTGSTDKQERYGANSVAETFVENMVFSNGGNPVVFRETDYVSW